MNVRPFADLPSEIGCQLLGRRARSTSLGDLLSEGWQKEVWVVLAQHPRQLRAVDATPEQTAIINGSQQTVADRAAQAGIGLHW